MEMLHGESSEESSGPLKLQNKRCDMVRGEPVRQNCKDMCRVSSWISDVLAHR